MSRSFDRLPSLLAALVLILVLVPAVTANAQTDRSAQIVIVKPGNTSCGAGWSNPVVCQVDIYVSEAGERKSNLLERHRLELPAGGEKDLWIVPVKQDGRRFPFERYHGPLVPDSSCSGLLTLSGPTTDGIYRLRAANRAGSCTLSMKVANNMNLDRQITIQVVQRQSPAPVEQPVGDRAELLTRWLYRGLLGYDPSATELANTRSSLQSYGAEMTVRTLLSQPAFQARRSQLTPEQMLNDLYSALLGRAPDSSGAASFLPRMRQGDYVDVVLTLVNSQELQTRLTEMTTPRR